MRKGEGPRGRCVHGWAEGEVRVGGAMRKWCGWVVHTWYISHVAWNKPNVFWVELHRALDLCRWAMYLHWLVPQVFLPLCLLAMVIQCEAGDDGVALCYVALGLGHEPHVPTHVMSGGLAVVRDAVRRVGVLLAHVRVKNLGFWAEGAEGCGHGGPSRILLGLWVVLAACDVAKVLHFVLVLVLVLFEGCHGIVARLGISAPKMLPGLGDIACGINNKNTSLVVIEGVLATPLVRTSDKMVPSNPSHTLKCEQEEVWAQSSGTIVCWHTCISGDHVG